MVVVLTLHVKCTAYRNLLCVHTLLKIFCFLLAASILEVQDKDLKCSIIAEALRRDRLGFGFSAGGLLFPYYIGIVDQLAQINVITGTSLYASREFDSSALKL
jgi:hypothetical protein